MTSNSQEDQSSLLEQIFAGNIPLEVLPTGLVIPQHMEASIPGLTEDPSTGLSIVREPGNTGVLRYVNEYMAVDDYLELGSESYRRDLLVKVLNTHSRDEILRALGMLALIVDRKELHDDLINSYIDFLNALPAPSSASERFTNSLSQKGKRSFLVRQFILAAFRLALGTPEASLGKSPLPALTHAILLTHLLAMESPRRLATPSNDSFGGLPEDLATEMIRNQVFYNSEDLAAAVNRTVQLWRTHGPAASDHLNGREPSEIFKTATGVEIEDFMAIGLAIYLFGKSWNPQTQGIALAQDFGTNMPANVHSMVIEHLALDKEGFSQKFQGFNQSWNFRPFEDFPLLKIENTLVIIDMSSLLERFTSGLYWFAFNHLRDAEGDAGRNSWGKAWGQMVESYSEELLQSLAPTTFYNQTSQYTEEDLKIAYPKQKRADVVIDFGSTFGIFEIVSGRLTVPTRIDGSLTALTKDIEKIVLEKIRQLNRSALDLIVGEERLTGISVSLPRRMQPVLIAGGGFPVSVPTMRYIREWCQANSMLQHPLIDPLAIIELDELEILAGLAENGHSPIELLAEWQHSDLGDISFKNFLFEQFPLRGNAHQYRASSVRVSIEQTFPDLIDRLGLGRS